MGTAAGVIEVRMSEHVTVDRAITDHADDRSTLTRNSGVDHDIADEVRIESGPRSQREALYITHWRGDKCAHLDSPRATHAVHGLAECHAVSVGCAAPASRTDYLT